MNCQSQLDKWGFNVCFVVVVAVAAAAVVFVFVFV